VARVAGDTLAPSVKVRETADRDTPASSATRMVLTEDFLGGGVSFLSVRPFTLGADGFPENS
jgi:hypothetical protein